MGSFFTVLNVVADISCFYFPHTSCRAESVGVVGTCFGSYIVMHLSASGQQFIRGGVSLHPSHPQLMEMAMEDEAAVYFMIETPQFFMDTPDSSENVREGGLASTIIETTYF